MKIRINGELFEYETPKRIIEMISNDNYEFMAAKVNNRLRELDYVVTEDADIELLTISDSSVTRIYQATLRYIIVMAVKNLWPKARISFNYSVSRSIFAQLSNFGKAFSAEDLELIEKEVKRIIEADTHISRRTLSKEEAGKYFKEVGWPDKEKILKYRPEDTVHIYECGNYKNYMYGYMLPSTGYIKDYKLRLYSPGFLITYPRCETKGQIPDFKDEKVFRTQLKEANIWSNISKTGYISQMNEIIENGDALEFINICEARHNNQLAKLGETIFSNRDEIKLICVAGPSSSGKTTFTNRLRIELKARGIEPLMISMDNFYKPVSEAPKDEDGKPDLEHIDALDLDLFDDCIFRLIQGEAVELPVYDFTGKGRQFLPPVKLNKNQAILIEGIHGLNDRICPSIPVENKFKVYIAPLAQYNIDDHNPISISDIRLIRRMVRDYNFRGTGCEKTLATWQSVRNGEFKWIYPYQNNADFVFNSELSYELCVMKKHAVHLLQAIDSKSEYFISANRLLKFLKYFEEISDKWVPCNSILREFIGDSIFYTEDKR